MWMTQGYRVRYTVGLEFTKDGCANTEVGKVIEQARKYAAKLFGGYTETLHNGGWYSPDGELVTERGLTFEVVIDPEKTPFVTVSNFATYLRTGFKQEVVLVVKEPVEYAFH